MPVALVTAAVTALGRAGARARVGRNFKRFFVYFLGLEPYVNGGHVNSVPHSQEPPSAAAERRRMPVALMTAADTAPGRAGARARVGRNF